MVRSVKMQTWHQGKAQLVVSVYSWSCFDNVKRTSKLCVQWVLKLSRRHPPGDERLFINLAALHLQTVRDDHNQD